MATTYPGTTIETLSIYKNSSKILFEGIFAAGGITMSQISNMTGLEPYLIQNWVKRKFLSSPLKKLYSSEQFARILIINMLRDSLQIEAISNLIDVIGGEPDAIYAKMEAQARGAEEILKKQAADFAEIVKSAGGNAEAALKLLIADKLEDLMRVQVDAVKNIKIDKVTVWDGGQNGDGKTSTANFISGMMKSVPPLDEVFAMAGMQLPSLLGNKLPEEAEDVIDAPVESKAEEPTTEITEE